MKTNVELQHDVMDELQTHRGCRNWSDCPRGDHYSERHGQKLLGEREKVSATQVKRIS
jgi:hypothetical protein